MFGRVRERTNRYTKVASRVSKHVSIGETNTSTSGHCGGTTKGSHFGQSGFPLCHPAAPSYCSDSSCASVFLFESRIHAVVALVHALFLFDGRA